MIIATLLTLVIIVSFGYLNRIRGAKKPWYLPNKLVCYAAMTLIWVGGQFLLDTSAMLERGTILGYAIPYTQEWMLHSVIFFLLWLCFAPGWGKFFPAGGNYSASPLPEYGGKPLWLEDEFPPAQWMANLIIGKWEKEESKSWVQNWQTVAMSFRFFFTFGLILFPYMSAITENYLYIIYSGLGTILVGPIYRWAFTKHNTRSIVKAEYGTGILIGLLLAIPIMRRKKRDGPANKESV